MNNHFADLRSEISHRLEKTSLAISSSAGLEERIERLGDE
jgi:hypothetical protein